MKKSSVKLTKEQGERYERASKIATLYEEQVFFAVDGLFCQN